MAHEDFDTVIEELTVEFEATTQAILQLVGLYIDGSASAADAEEAIEAVGDTLKAMAQAWAADTIANAYLDGVTEALKVSPSGQLSPEDHETMMALAQRRLQRRLAHAADGLVVDGLDKLDDAVEARLAPLKSDEATP